MEESTEIESTTEKMSREVAEAEFDRFCEAMDLDVDLDGMDQDDRKSLDDGKRRFIRAMLNGRLVVDEQGRAVYTPVLGNTAALTFHEHNGAALMETDKAKKNHDMKKSMFVLAGLTKTHPKRFADMKGRDLKVCQAIMGFLLGG